MSARLRLTTTVLPGHRIEVTAPGFPEGTRVEVTVAVGDRVPSEFGSALDFLDSLPPGPRAFAIWDDYERHLEDERNSWEPEGHSGPEGTLGAAGSVDGPVVVRDADG